MSPSLREHFDQALDVAAKQRLAARQPELRHALVDEDPGEARDLLEREELRAREKFVVGAVDLLGHAVHAAEVAAVRDRDAQIVQRPAEGVGHGPRQPGADRRGAHEAVERIAARGSRVHPQGE